MLATLSAPVLLLIGWLVVHIFALMGHDPVQQQLEKSYFLILIYGAFFTLSKTCIASYFAGIGSTRVVMVADVLGILLNIPLSYALIFGVAGLPELGIVGAGVGTIIATAFTLCLFAYFYFNRQHRRQFKVRESFVMDGAITRKLLRLGLPSGVEMFLNVAAFNLFILMFQSYGIAEAASITIVLNWDIMSYVPMLGLHIALISLIGRYVGAQNMVKTNEAIAAGFLLGLGYTGLLALVFIAFRATLVDVFITPGADYQAIHDLSTDMMIGLASYTLADATILVAGGVLRGAGDTRWLMKTSVLLHWAMLIVQCVVIYVLDYGPRTSWVVFVCMIFSIAVVYLIRLYGRKWLHPDALRQVVAH